MNNVIHIVNGDSTAQILSKSSIKGDIIVWREMLCEGALQLDVGSDQFWSSRYQFFESELGVNRLDYFDKTVKEIQKIDRISKNNEIVMWFEYDLFCQINLLALCSYLLKFYRKDIKYSLICTGKEKNKERLQSLSDYSPIEYESLLFSKLNISRTNLLFASQCWDLYVENNFERLKEFDFDKYDKFPYLQQALNQHLQRFPNENGLNQIDHKILTIIKSNKYSKVEIVKALLIWQQKETVYGFGDLQYYRALNKLKPFYQVADDLYSLNDNGKAKLT